MGIYFGSDPKLVGSVPQHTLGILHYDHCYFCCCCCYCCYIIKLVNHKIPAHAGLWAMYETMQNSNGCNQ